MIHFDCVYELTLVFEDQIGDYAEDAGTFSLDYLLSTAYYDG